MDVTEWTYKEFPGLPGDGEPGYFLGFDADLQPYVLKWRSGEHPCWLAATLDDAPEAFGAGPIVHALIDSNAGKIVKWATLPVRWSVLQKDWAASDDRPLKADGD